MKHLISFGIIQESGSSIVISMSSLVMYLKKKKKKILSHFQFYSKQVTCEAKVCWHMIKIDFTCPIQVYMLVLEIVCKMFIFLIIIMKNKRRNFWADRSTNIVLDNLIIL